jgi:hypothetical protein
VKNDKQKCEARNKSEKQSQVIARSKKQKIKMKSEI